ncbi:MAG: CDP-glycerol glycerophosphotransferase family protein [Bacteroidota bacterium]
MNVLIWATTFGADLWSLARHLDARDDVTLKVVLDDPQGFQREGVARVFPLEAELIQRKQRHNLLGKIPGFAPDITVMDKEVPLRAPSPAGLMLWHGFGWKGPDDVQSFAWMHRAIKTAFGDPQQPNPRFRWQCFGPWDLEFRSTVSGLHPENCQLIGAVSHDDLRTPLDRTRAQPFYPFDVVDTPTVLIAPTWHYGEVFAHWGRDDDLFERLLVHLRQRGANVILRLHDAFRFESAYVAFLRDLAVRHPHVVLKFKNEHPDNYLDLQVADVLVTNYSSIANLFYATGRPTVHVYPVRSADEVFQWRQRTIFGVRTKEVESAHYVWKQSPEEHGGLLARDFEALLASLDRALDDPMCCASQARAFLDKHMLGADGRNGERAWRVMQDVVASARDAGL